jgi:hypothetical protein
MAPQWSSALQIFQMVAYLVKEFALDGLHLYFTSHRSSCTSKNTTTLLCKLREKRPEGTHDVSKIMSVILEEYQSELGTQARRSKSKWRITAPPLSLYIFMAEGSSNAFDLARPIKGIVSCLEKLQLGPSQTGIQFITFPEHALYFTGLGDALSDASLARYVQLNVSCLSLIKPKF